MNDDPQGAGAPADNANALPAGTRLHEFEIERVLGAGGFAIVYLAFDHSLHRRIALKEYLPVEFAFRHDADTVLMRSVQHRETFDAGLKSFVQEARFLAQFEHPSLVKVHRVFEAHGTAYMAQGYYAGATLREMLKAGQAYASEADLRALIVPLLDAVELLHGKQCLHRDIAPDNIIVQPNGVPVLLDFGAARRIIGDMTQALTAVLKPSYAPIEQYTEEGGLAQGPWTDVYGLAAVLRAAITGKPPPGAIGRSIKDALVPFEQAPPPGFGLAFLRGIDAGLALLPDARPQSIAAFREALGIEAPVRLSRKPASAPVPSGVPVTQAPTTTTQAPTAQAPTTQMPTTQTPTTQTPTTQTPITYAPPANATAASADSDEDSVTIPRSRVGAAPVRAPVTTSTPPLPPPAVAPPPTNLAPSAPTTPAAAVAPPSTAPEPPRAVPTPRTAGATPPRAQRNTARNAAIVVALLAVAAIAPFVYVNVADDLHRDASSPAANAQRAPAEPVSGTAAPAERDATTTPVAVAPTASPTASNVAGPGASSPERTAAPPAPTAPAPPAALKGAGAPPPLPARDAPPPAAAAKTAPAPAAPAPPPKSSSPEPARVESAAPAARTPPAPAAGGPSPTASPAPAVASAPVAAATPAVPTATSTPTPVAAPAAAATTAAPAPAKPPATAGTEPPRAGMPPAEVARAEPTARPAVRRRVERVAGEAPVYPREAVRQGINSGRVVALVQIDERGNVVDVDITKSEPPRVFDRAARTALQGWKFRAEGERYVGEVEINFSLKE